MNFKKILLSTLVVHLFFAVNAQVTFQEHVIRIIANDPSIVPWNEKPSSDDVFNQILLDFDVVHISRPMQFAKTVALQNCFEIYTPHDADSLGKAFMHYDSLYGKLLSVERIPTYKDLDIPSDYFWYASSPDGDFMWYLKKMQAEQAWDITHGDPNVKVAVIDKGVDMNHPDLIGKIDPPYDFYTGQPFTTVPNDQIHGTSVSTLIAAETKDVGEVPNGDMPSIGWNTKIMFASRLNAPFESFPNPDGSNSTYTFDRPDLMALYASTVMEAKVINVSWSFFDFDGYYDIYFTYYPNGIASYLLIEKEILDNGTSIVRAAGNDHGEAFSSDGTQSRLYPFSGYEDYRTLVVSSTGPDDKHQYFYGAQPYTNSHYPEVDLCAPGYSLLCGSTTDGGQSEWPYGPFGGTSQSTPLVVGTIALMHAVNPCLGSSMAHDIIKNTTDPIVDAADFPGGVGTGRLNSYKAVLAAQNAVSQTLDLFIKDRPEDFGDEMYPYHWQAPRDESPDIWVRNQPDGFTNTTNQEPEYNSGNPVYVYVRVHNKSCVTSNGDELLRLYWTKASSSNSWPQNWDGSQPTVGNVIGSIPIGVLEPGEEKVIQFTWTILNPNIYNNWASCLMARIENVPADPITIYPNNAGDDVFFNNNIALRNCTVVDVVPGIIDGEVYPAGKYVYVGNVYAEAETYDFLFNFPDDMLFEDAEVDLFFDPIGWSVVKGQVLGSSHFKVIKDGVVRIDVEDAAMLDVLIPANTRFPVYVGFSFYADAATAGKTYKFDLQQHLSNDVGSYVGGEHFTIIGQTRLPFHADAGPDQTINQGASVNLTAATISEEVIYNWYDYNGTRIHVGQNLTVSPNATTTYKLEVIAASDGAKSYDDVQITVKENFIALISPNPTSTTTQVTYTLADNITSASLMITGQNAGSKNGTILDVNQTSVTLNTQNLQTGTYTLSLICNGVIMDTQVLVKQ